MKALSLLFPARILFVVMAAITLLASGCASTKKVDWDARVGAYSYDDAIAELGPPDKQAKLSDGKTVAEWITRRSGGMSLGVGTGFSSGHTGVGVGQSVGTGRRDNVLRLTFGSDGKLTAWARN